MNRVIMFLTLTMMSTFVFADGIRFINQAVFDGQTIVRSGTLVGLANPPTGGTYEVFITNAKSFKGEEFSIMKCTVHKELATPMAAKFKNVVVLDTAYFTEDGKVYNARGYLAGMTALPIDGYTVKVNNKAKDGIWNLLKCTIK